MNRRQFVSTALPVMGAAAGLTSFTTASAAPGEFAGIIKKAVKFNMVNEPDLSVLDRFKLLKDLGYDGTELSIGDLEQATVFREAVDKSGLPVHGIVAAASPELVSSIDFAKDLGADSVLYVARYDHSKPLMESWKSTQEVVRAALPAAEGQQVRILIENVWAGFLISALDAERYIDEIGSPWFGAYFDVGNNVRWGVPEHWIEILGSRIGKIDIKEWDQKKHQAEGLGKGFSSELGEGTINWEKVRRALKATGFQGWATAEVGGGGRERLADIARRMDKVLGLTV